jgi:predicted MFS family arabinose efflux permease
VAIFNGAIGLGAVLGAFVLSLAGLAQNFLIAAAATALGTIVIVLLSAPAGVPVPVE